MEFILIILYFFTIFEFTIGYIVQESYFEKPIGNISNIQYKIVFVSQGNGLKLLCSDGNYDVVNKCNTTTSISWSVFDIDFINKNNFYHRLNGKPSLPKKLSVLQDKALLIRKVNVKYTTKLFSCYKNTTNSNITDTKVYNYMIEIINPDTDICEGTVTDWTNFSSDILKPLQNNLEQSYSTKDKNVSLEIDWTGWTTCLCSLFEYSNRRYKFGYPLIRINVGKKCMNSSSELYYIRSEKFKAYHPYISNKIKKLKVFRLYESCIGFCENSIEVNYTSFQYEQVIKAAEGTNLAVTCPGSLLINSETLWIKDTDNVIPKIEDSFGIDSKETPICVDSNVLYLNNINMEVEGHYSCFVNRIPIKTFIVDVTPAEKNQIYDDLIESLLSLGIFLLFCLALVGINLLKKLYDISTKSVDINDIEV